MLKPDSTNVRNLGYFLQNAPTNPPETERERRLRLRRAEYEMHQVEKIRRKNSVVQKTPKPEKDGDVFGDRTYDR